MLNSHLGACVAPFTPAETAEASSWLGYIDAALAVATADPKAAIIEAIDKAQRRAGLSDGAAALLAQIFDVVPAEHLELA